MMHCTKYLSPHHAGTSGQLPEAEPNALCDVPDKLGFPIDYFQSYGRRKMRANNNSPSPQTALASPKACLPDWLSGSTHTRLCYSSGPGDDRKTRRHIFDHIHGRIRDGGPDFGGREASTTPVGTDTFDALWKSTESRRLIVAFDKAAFLNFVK